MADIHLLPKQTEALEYLEDEITEQVVFGGSVGSAKSFLGCAWIVASCFKYKGTRWAIGRSKLKQLRQTTLRTLFEVIDKMGIPKSHYNYNFQDNELKFSNGSEIIMKDLFMYPSDPLFDSLGSLEITGFFVDECNQCVEKAWTVMKSRVRFRLKDFDFDGTPTNTLEVARYDSEGVPEAWYRSDGSITEGLIPKCLGSCNPSKGWVYNNFYKPTRDGDMPADRVFIQALTKDNPHLSKSYVNSLMKMDKATKERLLFGNWEYDDDPAKLCDYDKILDLWTNDYVESGSHYISADIALQGSDKFVLGVWDGLRLIEIYTEAKSTGKGILDKIDHYRRKYKVPNSNIIYDADGLGGSLSGFISGAIEFKNGRKPLNGENYNHLKSQCYFKLAELINEGKIFIATEAHKETLIEELEYIKRDNVDKDGKLMVLSKDKVKEFLSRSPDLSDMVMMRTFYEIGAKFQSFNPNFF